MKGSRTTYGPRTLHDPRSGRLPWVTATGSKSTLRRKAECYLVALDYKKAAKYDLDTEILAKVVCNLRNYYQQDADETIALISRFFLPKAWDTWTDEAIRMVWELVEDFTPFLGAVDAMAIAKRRAAFMENEVVDLIAWTVSGGRVSVEHLRTVFREWNPDLEFTDVEFGLAVKAVTGLKSKGSHGTRYWNGFHLPTSEEGNPPEEEAA